MSQEEGAELVKSGASQSFDCLRFYQQLYPSCSERLSVVADLIRQAYQIYLFRVSAGSSRPASTELVEHFKCTLERFPNDLPGHHVLIWATFIVASESSDPEHQVFFTEFLLRQHTRNGFFNIIVGLRHLRKIWERIEGNDWTLTLPEMRVFVM